MWKLGVSKEQHARSNVGHEDSRINLHSSTLESLISTVMNLANYIRKPGPAAVDDTTPVAVPDAASPCREACSPVLSDPAERRGEIVKGYLEEATQTETLQPQKE